MAHHLTPGRVALAVLAIGMVLGLGLRIDSFSFRSNRDDEPAEARAAYIARNRAQLAIRDWRIATVADSVRRAVASAGASFIVGGGVSDDARALIHEMMQAAPEIPRAPGHPRSVVAVVSDTLRSVADWNNGWGGGGTVVFMLPGEPAEPCITLVIAPRAGWTHRQFSSTYKGTIPGLCGFFAAFGIPGSHVRDWLRTTQALPGAVFAAERHPPFTVGESTSILGFYWIGELSLENETACIAGRASGCSRWLAGPRHDARLRTVAGNAVLPADPGWAPRPGYFLSDLLLTRGPEQFTRFWQSERPVHEAFEEVYGQPLGEWAVEWLRTIGVPPVRELRATTPVIPGVLLICLASLAAVLLYVPRRTVSV